MFPPEPFGAMEEEIEMIDHIVIDVQKSVPDFGF